MVDRGQPDRRLAAALTQDVTVPAGRAELLAALLEARVFAAITATATGREPAGATGLSAESGAELAIVLLAAEDGSRALPVFPDLVVLRAWAPDLRPVPLTGAQACAAAIEQGAETVLLDPGGTSFALGRDELEALAAGWAPISGSSLASRRTVQALGAPTDPPEQLLAALRRAIAPERLLAARLLAGPEGPVLGVTPSTRLTPAALAALADRVRTRMGSDLPATGLDLAVVDADGVGTDLLRRGRLRRRGR